MLSGTLINFYEKCCLESARNFQYVSDMIIKNELKKSLKNFDRKIVTLLRARSKVSKAIEEIKTRKIKYKM